MSSSEFEARHQRVLDAAIGPDASPDPDLRESLLRRALAELLAWQAHELAGLVFARAERSDSPVARLELEEAANELDPLVRWVLPGRARKPRIPRPRL